MMVLRHEEGRQGMKMNDLVYVLHNLGCWDEAMLGDAGQQGQS